MTKQRRVYLYSTTTSLAMSDKRRLEELAKGKGITVSEYLRDVILNHIKDQQRV